MSKIKKVGPYVVSILLGEGKFGKVKLGTHAITNEKVALKILSVNNAKTLDREISSMQLLQHPNVVKLIEIIDIPEKDKICLVMEYMEGGDLYDYIEGNPAHEKLAANFFHQLLSAVNHCHERQVVHRDLKPENILLDKSGTIVKIADFGLCNQIESGSFLISNCGSPLYASPEILLGKRYGPQVDAWSLGVILYAMLTGYMPWPGNTLQEQVLYAISGRYVPLTNVSEGCKDVVSRLLVTDPDSRATIKELLDHPWVIQGKQLQHADLKSIQEKLKSLKLEGRSGSPSTLDP